MRKLIFSGKHKRSEENLLVVGNFLTVKHKSLQSHANLVKI